MKEVACVQWVGVCRVTVQTHSVLPGNSGAAVVWRPGGVCYFQKLLTRRTADGGRASATSQVTGGVVFALFFSPNSVLDFVTRVVAPRGVRDATPLGH